MLDTKEMLGKVEDKTGAFLLAGRNYTYSVGADLGDKLGVVSTLADADDPLWVEAMALTTASALWNVVQGALAAKIQSAGL